MSYLNTISDETINSISAQINAEAIQSKYRELLPDSRNSKFSPDVVTIGWVSQIAQSGSSNNTATSNLLSIYPDKNISSDATGGFTKAKLRYPKELPKILATGQAVENQMIGNENHPLWKEGKVYTIDGTTHTATDTPQNQENYPQHANQKDGVGNPILRSVFLGTVAGGSIVDAGFGSYKGKGTGEKSIAAPLIEKNITKGDLVLADRYYECVGIVEMIVKREAFFIFPSHGARKIDFRTGKKLGSKDHLVEYKDEDGETMTVRQVEITLTYNGFRNVTFTIVTNLIDADKWPPKKLAELYLERWNIELDLRKLKCQLGINHIECKTPEMIYKHFWFAIYTYNLIVRLILSCGVLLKRTSRSISFSSALSTFTNNLKNIAFKNFTKKSLYKIAKFITKKIVGNRPGRKEPRKVKRRKKSKYKLMHEKRERTPCLS